MQVGTKEWFDDRAKHSLKLISPGHWDFSDSALLYTTQGVEAYKEEQKNEDAKYKKEVTDKETNLIKNITPKVIKFLPEEFDYIDLGPGTEHKEQYFFDSIKAQNKKFTYCPVDVSREILEDVKNYAEKQGILVTVFQNTFEELPSVLKGDKYRFVSLGLTVINYEPNEILNLLKNITGTNGSIFVTLHVRDRINIQDVKAAYETPTTSAIFSSKLGLLGIDKSDADLIFSDEITISAKIKKDFENIGLHSGDTVLVQRTYRYKVEDFKNIAEHYFDVETFDEGGEFVGILLKTRYI